MNCPPRAPACNEWRTTACASPQLVIFDCDGVLVDTEKMSALVLTKELNNLGLNLSIEEADRKFRGRSLKDCFAIVEKEMGRPLPHDFPATLDKRTYSAYRTGLSSIAGVRQVLQGLLDQLVPICVASSGSHEKMNLTLGLTGLLPYFNGALYSATEVRRGKPAPDLFCYAAQKMDVPIEHSIVIEDSLAGATAGLKAGARVFAYVPENEENHLKIREEMTSLGALPFSAMAELPSLLRTPRPQTG